MKKILLVAIIAVELKCTFPIKTQSSEVAERLSLLKSKLVQDIMRNRHGMKPLDVDIDIMESKTARDGPITPITRPRKKKVRTEAPTTAKEVNITKDAETESHTIKPLRMKQLNEKAKKWAKHLKKYGQPVEVFYRRDINKEVDDEERRSRHILLCVDLLRPILAGMKKNVTHRQVLGDQIANRLIQLLSYGAAGQTAEDIESILYQINALQLRFFQWDVTALKKLFNFIMPGQSHTFRSLKYGVKRIFAMWHMDLSNTNLLIKDSRMFRPPCIGVVEGSTRSSLGIRYTKSPTPKTTCPPKDKLCQKNEEYSSNEDKK